METISYTTIDKAEWDRGPWDEEPDKIQWQDEATGIPCLAKRHPTLGHWCGYVSVTEGHPLFEKSYSDALDLDVHGGVTYTGFCDNDACEADGICHLPEPGEPEHVWWLGFDCCHFLDVSPGLDATMRKINSPPMELPDDPVEMRRQYRTLAYVQLEAASLAKQLAEMTND